MNQQTTNANSQILTVSELGHLMMMYTSVIAIGKCGVQPTSQLVIGRTKEDKETTDYDDEQPRKWANDENDDLMKMS